MLDAYLATAAAASPLLRSPELVRSWTRRSALEEFAVSGLAAHLALGVLIVEQFLDTPLPPDGVPIDAVAFYLLGDHDAPVDDPAKQRIRAVSDQRAVPGPAALADAYDECRERLAKRLAGLEPDLQVTVFRRVLPLDQVLLTRIIELAVHLDDLAVSLDVPTPAIPDEAAELVATTLARIAVGRRGLLPVLRALSRRERATDLATAF